MLIFSMCKFIVWNWNLKVNRYPLRQLARLSTKCIYEPIFIADEKNGQT
jgi:hypothetical protein